MGATGILLTGATGLVGAELVPRLLRSRPASQIYCLMRSQPDRPIEQRLQALLEWADVSEEDRDRVIAVEGEVTCEDLGLSDGYDALAREIGEIFHAAANTRHDLTLEQLRRINRDGLEHVIRLARRARDLNGLKRLNHVSTAFVDGDPTVAPDAQGRPCFRNPYEESKWEAELLLNGIREELPLTCYRPSSIVGDSRTGRTLHFHVMYEPIKWVYLGGLSKAPWSPEVRFDIVPVDYVCDAMMALSINPEAVGKSYYLTCGPARAMAAQEFVRLVAETGHEWQRRDGETPTPLPELVRVDGLSEEEREMLAEEVMAAGSVARTYMPYLFTEQLFDDGETRAALANTGIECPPLKDYLAALVAYASERRYHDMRL